MASRGASLFAFFFCNEKKKGGFGAPPRRLPFFLGVAVQNSARVSVRRLFFQICAGWAGLSLGDVWLYATLAQRDRPDGQIWKNVAH